MLKIMKFEENGNRYLRNAIWKDFSDKIFIHASENSAEITEIFRFSELNIPSKINVNLSAKGFLGLNKLQAYAMKPMNESESVLIVASLKSGKTTCFLIPLISILSRDNQQEEEESTGPIALIISHSSREVEKICKMCNELTAGSLIVAKAFGKKFDKNFINNSDLLITTPLAFSSMRNEKVLEDNHNFKHLVFDNFDLIADKYENDINNIVKICLNQTIDEERPQLIVTSSTWHYKMNDFLCNTPLVFIDSIMEVAVYAKTRFIFLRMSAEEKKLRLLEHCKTREFLTKKTLIVVKHKYEEVELQRLLINNCIQVQVITGERLPYVNVAEEIFQDEPRGRKTLLLATDESLKDVNMDCIQILIHYSLPDKSKDFCARFSNCFGYYRKYLSMKNAGEEFIPRFIVMLNEDVHTDVAKIINFLTDPRVRNKFSSDIQQLVERTLKEIEMEKEVSTQICSKIMKFGKCEMPYKCSDRHIISDLDASLPNLSKNKLIKFRIVGIISPTHFSIRILAYRDSVNDSWTIYVGQTEMIKLKLKELGAYLNNEDNRHYPFSIDVGDIYAYFCVEKQRWFRVKILKLSTKRNKVIVALIDQGKKMILYANQIFQIPEEFKTYPTLTNDLRLLNLVPPDGEEQFNHEATKELTVFFNDEKNKCEFFMARVGLSIQNTIFSEDFFMYKYDKKIELKSFTFSMKRHVLSRGLAESDETIYIKLEKILNNAKCIKEEGADEIPVTQKYIPEGFYDDVETSFNETLEQLNHY